MSNNPIRLTNKTAILIRKSAVKSLNIHYACAALLSALMCVPAVLLGLKWLWAVPVVVGITVIVDMLIVFYGRRVYISMIGQAICTEAAAREIRTGISETQRREKALTDLLNVKADVQRAEQEAKNRKKADRKKPVPIRYDDEEEDDDLKAAPVRAYQEEAAPRRRRREEGLKLIR